MNSISFFRKLQSRPFLSILTLSLLVIGFQNCSQVAFEPDPNAPNAFTNSSLSADPQNNGSSASIKSFAINEGAEFTNDMNVRIKLDALNAKEMILKNDSCPQESETGWVAYNKDSLFALANSDGKRQVFARVRDGNNKASLCIQSAIVLDQVKPLLQNLMAPNKFHPSTSSSFSFEAMDLGSGVDKYFCRINSQSQYSQCMPQVILQNLADGSKSLNLYVADRAGNISVPFDYSWIVDTTQPTVAFTAPLVANEIYQKSATFHFIGNDGDGSGIQGYKCSLNNQALATCSSPQSLNNLADGTNVFRISAVDKVGLESVSIAHEFVVDTQGSSAFQILGVTGASDTKMDAYLTANTTPVLHWEVSQGNQGYRLHIYNEGKTQQICSFNSLSATTTNQMLSGCGTFAANNKYVAQVVAIRNGIETNSPDFTFTVDYTGPQIQILNIVQNDLMEKALIEFTVTDISGVAEASCFKKFGTDTKQDNCLGKTSIEYTNLLAGNHGFQISAKDSLGNSTTSNPVSFTMIAKPPVIACEEDEVYSGTECVKRNPDCKSYQEVSQNNGTFIIPGRSSAEVCYYIKVFDAVPNGPSQLSRSVRTDIKSRDHSKGSIGEASMAHPLVMGQRAVNVQLLGARKVLVASDRFATKNIKVDNFVLVEITRSNLSKVVWGAGSGDVKYRDASGVLSVKLNDVPFTYEVYAPGGTSEFSPVDFTQYVPLNEPISIGVSALDCRGSEESTDGYLIFK